MADFVAVLRRTLDGLNDPSAEMREKVYNKARSTIEAKLAAINPPPPQSVVDRQKQALEEAIAEIEATYATLELDIDDEALDDLLAEDDFEQQPPRRAEPTIDRPRRSEPALDQGRRRESAAPSGERREPVFDDMDGDEFGADGTDWDREDDDFEAPRQLGRRAAGRKARRSGRMLLALVLLLGLVGVGYAVWQNRDGLLDLTGLGGPSEDMSVGQEDISDMPPEDADTAAMSGDEDAEAIGEEVGTDASDGGAAQKFTQRLLEDGQEVDPGPSDGGVTTGEGTSVASASPGGTGGPSGAPVPPGDTTLPVGQKAIFYEERTNALQGSAEAGQVLWSLIEESPGEGLPPEPAIRAEATIPGKDIQFRMTIQRNRDESLPASHIIEMIFLVPEGFDGGAIDNVLRVAFKDSEQSPGNPLLGIPAKISDGYFLLALSDSEAEIAANNMMMRRLDWLDIPIVYRSGRRALITLEKGIPGAKVFEDALKAWAPESAETSQ